MTDCLFCKIIAGEIETKKIYENKNVLCFYDIYPLADTHILILPKEHVPTFLDIKSTHKDLFSEMITIAQNLIKDYNLESAFRLMFNGGRYQHAPHLHWHLLGGNMRE